MELLVIPLYIFIAYGFMWGMMVLKRYNGIEWVVRCEWPYDQQTADKYTRLYRANFLMCSPLVFPLFLVWLFFYGIYKLSEWAVDMAPDLEIKQK